MATRTEFVGLVIAGIVAAYVLSDPEWWPLAVLSVAFFFHVLHNETHPVAGLRVAAAYGFTLVGGSTYWFLWGASHAGTGIENILLTLALTGSAWLISTITLSIPFAVGGYAYVRLKRNAWTDILLATCVFVLAEFLRPFMFAIQTFAPESLFGAHWTFGMLGYTLAGSSILLQGAAIGGVYLLSATVFLLAAILAWVYREQIVSNVQLSIAVCTVALLLSLPFPPATPRGLETPTIVALKVTEPAYFSATEVDRHARLDRIELLIRNTLELYPNADFIVLPEDSRFIALGGADRLAAMMSSTTAALIDSARIETTDTLAHSRITTYSLERGTELHYTKRILVPEGEYLSYLYRGILHLAGMHEALERYQRVKAYTPGFETTPTPVGDTFVAASLCSELYSPHLIRELAEHAGVITNLASLSRFQGLSVVDGQNKAMAQVRAVENGRYLVRATNYGTAYSIDHRGTLIAESAENEAFASIATAVPLRYERTLFSYAPYTTPILGFILVLYFWYLRR